jgi:O-antigen ligase
MSPRKTSRQKIDPAMLSLRLANILLYGTFGLLMFGPIAFGAVEPWSIFVLEAGSVALLMVWLAKQWIDGQFIIRWNDLFLPMGAFGILVLTQIGFRLSAYRHATVSEFLVYCSYAVLCFLSRQALVRSAQAQKIAVLLTIYGFLISSVSLIQGVSPNGKLYWIRVPRLGGWIYGPYVNHNHYAGLMELLVPIPLILALSRLAEDRERIVAAIVAAVMVCTLFLSGSRGGMLAILVELAFLGVVLFRHKKRIRTAVGLGAFAVVLVGMLTWLGGKELTQRVSSISHETRTEISGGMRVSIDRDTVRMFRSKPVLGWGLDTFPVVYPQFRSFYTNFFINEAHDDYLQLLAETGVIGFAIMLWFVVVVYRNGLRKIGNWMSEVSGSVTLACLLGFTGILVHSLVDFNLHIPANAAIFYVFCTIAAAPPLAQRSRKRKPANPTEPAENVMPASEVV